MAGGAGLAPVAPGTAGAAVTLPVFVLLSPLSPMLFALTVVALLFLGVWAANGAEAHFGRKDDGRIVIDEVVGQLVTFAPLQALPLVGGRVFSDAFASQGLSASNAFVLVTGFVLFRLFDIWKPGAVRWAERRFPGGLGVMLDDVVAGALAAGLLAAGLWLLSETA